MLKHPDPVEGMRPMYVAKRDDTRPHIVAIHGEEGGIVSFVNLGGGFVYSAQEAKFTEEFEPLPSARYHALMNTHEKAYAQGDWFAAELPGIPAYFTADTWNGWACPSFEAADAICAISDGRIGGVIWVAELEAFLEIDTMGEPIPHHDFAAEAKSMGDELVKTVKIGDLEVEIVKVTGNSIVTEEGPKLVFPIGSHSWCWWREETPLPEVTAAPAP